MREETIKNTHSVLISVSKDTLIGKILLDSGYNKKLMKISRNRWKCYNTKAVT